MVVSPYSISAPIGRLGASGYARVNRLTLGHASRLARFGVVGIFGVLVNSAILFLLVSTVHLNHLIAASISAELSILVNFALNDRWTFRDAQPCTSWPMRAAQYNGVAFAGMALSLAILAALTDGLGMYYMVANLFGMTAAALSNYALNCRITWRHQPELVPVLEG